MAREPYIYRAYPIAKGNIPEWATYIAGRSPRFKVHDALGTAKTAITVNGHGIIYRRTAKRDGDLLWIPVAVINEGEAATHPYRKCKPQHLTEPVILFVIREEPVGFEEIFGPVAQLVEAADSRPAQ